MQKKEHSLCFTGHRSEKLPKTAEQLETLKLRLWEEINKAIENGIDTFYCGACYVGQQLRPLQRTPLYRSAQ